MNGTAIGLFPSLVTETVEHQGMPGVVAAKILNNLDGNTVSADALACR